MVSQGILIGVAVGVFFVGLGIGYAALQSTTTPMMMGPQQMMNDPQAMNQWHQEMMQNPDAMNQWMGNMMNDPQAMQQMHDMMMSNPQHMNQMMGPMMNNMMNDPNMHQGMMSQMMNHQGMMNSMMGNQDMMNMMGNNMMMGGMMMDGNMMMGNNMKNQLAPVSTIWAIGTGNTVTSSGGTASCIAGNTVAVSTSIFGGSVDNQIQGIARCSQVAGQTGTQVASATSVDPGNGSIDSDFGQGTATTGNIASCTPNYTADAASTTDSRWEVSCTFY